MSLPLPTALNTNVIEQMTEIKIKCQPNHANDSSFDIKNH